MALTPKHEEITGANLTGTSGDTDRTYTLANTGGILAQMQILLSENVQQSSVNFTFNATTGVVTFLGRVIDAQPITIDYFVESTSGALGTAYCTTLGIARASGIGVEVFTETLGTGTTGPTTSSFDSAKGNILAGSYSLFYGATGSNSFTTLIETTHYVLDKDKGLVELTAAGITELATNILYIDYVYSPRHSDTLLASYSDAINKEVEKITNNYWGADATNTQYFDGYTSGYPQTDEPYGEQIDPYPEYTLKYAGLKSITSIDFLNRQGTSDRTLDTDEYRILLEEEDNNHQEARLLINTTIPNGKAQIKVVYVHGYDDVPALIQELACYVGGVMALVNISGGSYKDVSTYSLGRKSFSIGQIYVNIRESIDQMNKRIDQLTLDMGGNFDCV